MYGTRSIVSVRSETQVTAAPAVARRRLTADVLLPWIALTVAGASIICALCDQTANSVQMAVHGAAAEQYLRRSILIVTTACFALGVVSNVVYIAMRRTLAMWAGRLASSDDAIASRYVQMFENAVEGMYQTSPEGKYISANPALAAIYGYDSPEDLILGMDNIGTKLYVNPMRRLELISILQQTGAIAEAVSQVYRRDGSVIWISESMKPVRDDRGRLVYFSGTVLDITAKRALEEERDRMLQEAVDRANHDPLTGLLNHRAFHRRLEIEADVARESGTRFAVLFLDLNNFKFFNDAHGHLSGDTVLQCVASTLKGSCSPTAVMARFGGDEFAVLLPERPERSIEGDIGAIQAALAGMTFEAPDGGMPIPLSVSAGAAIFPDEAADRIAAVDLADRRMLRAKSGRNDDEAADAFRRSMAMQLSGFSMLDALVTAVDNKDRYTRDHSEDVLYYSVAIAFELGMSGRMLYDIKVAALLHDVGKIGVPDHILRKPGRLTDDEFEAVRQHPMMGAAIVSTVPGLEATLDAVRHHHERWDGDGYPFGLRGEEIPYMARIMAVADAFSAMTTDRPYRKGLDARTALCRLTEGAGTQWDPHVVAAFLRSQNCPDGDSDDIRCLIPREDALAVAA